MRNKVIRIGNKRQLEMFGHTLLIDEGLVRRYEHSVGVDAIHGHVNGEWVAMALEDSPLYGDICNGLVSKDGIVAETERVLGDIADGYEKFEKNVEEKCKRYGIE